MPAVRSIKRMWLLPCIAGPCMAALLITAWPLPAQNTPGSDLAGMTLAFIRQHRTTGPRRDARSMAALRRILSAPFYRSLSVAFAEDRRFRARHPGVKPGHAEFSFMCADGTHQGFRVEPTRFHSSTAASVVVSFDFVHYGRKHSTRDRYLWVRERGGWRLDDIECDFEHPDRRASLRRGIGH